VLQSFIAQGKVTVDDRVVDKAGSPVGPSARVALLAEEPRYVCRGGLKLERALDHFGVDPAGLVCLDSGLSTGGFTDCLLQVSISASLSSSFAFSSSVNIMSAGRYTLV
jgi:23S rRNA (cytidine1920-2'-O)/16S rRNA (cytidine1409-2'-O)-methyltransferase